MERIELSRNEKRVLKRLERFGRDSQLDVRRPDVAASLRKLHRKGMVCCIFVEGGDIESVRLTTYAMDYLCENPHLYNPVDWKWIITTLLLLITAVAAVLNLFVACTLIK